MFGGIVINESNAKEVCEILKRFLAPDVAVYAFGSRTKGTTKRFADLDLALKDNAKIPQVVIDNLNIEFENSLLPFKVDIIDLNNIDPDFLKAISDDLIKIL